MNRKIKTVHVKNTGRCRKVLLSNATGYLEESDNPARKTKYDLITMECQITSDSLIAGDEIEIRL
ncbi:MAG: hypothetical protein IJ727_08830 [Treponema sp.]|nr:hypothetical protein [Treponema sp.]